jgi:hypothetical protein
MLDSFEHGGHGCMAELATRLMNTSKRYGAAQASSAAANGAAHPFETKKGFRHLFPGKFYQSEYFVPSSAVP